MLFRSAAEGETLVRLAEAGQFSGEVNLLTGRAAFVRIRAHEDGEVVVIDRDHVLRVLQLESEIGQIMMSRNETGDLKIELERLKMSIRDNFVTPYVTANGFGGVDMARLAKSIDQIALTYEFKNRPKAEDVFTSQYLPPAADRKL